MIAALIYYVLYTGILLKSLSINATKFLGSPTSIVQRRTSQWEPPVRINTNQKSFPGAPEFSQHHPWGSLIYTAPDFSKLTLSVAAALLLSSCSSLSLYLAMSEANRSAPMDPIIMAVVVVLGEMNTEFKIWKLKKKTIYIYTHNK